MTTPQQPLSVRVHALFLRTLAPGLWRRQQPQIRSTLADLHAAARASGRWLAVLRLIVREIGALIADIVRHGLLESFGGVTADIRFGARVLLKRPLTTAVMVLTIAVGIAATSTVFRSVHQVMFQPLPFEQPDQLVMLWGAETDDGPGAFGLATPAGLDAWRRGAGDLARFGAARNGTRSLTGLERPQSPLTTFVDPELFGLLGVAPAMGRGFDPDDARPGAEPVTILSHELWQQIGADPSMVGSALELDGQDVSVIGVMPAGFRYPLSNNPPRLWAPLQIDDWSDRHGRTLFVFARLEPGVQLPAFTETMDSIAAGMATEFPDTHGGRGVRVDPLQTLAFRAVRTPILILMAAVSFVLLIACVNVANLQLARALGRIEELRLRVALGASRVRVLRQLLVESFLIAFAGGGLGLLLTLWTGSITASFLPSWANNDFYRSGILNAQVVLFGIGATCLTAVLFGSVPAAALLRRTRRGATAAERTSTSGRSGQRVRRSLAIAEVAISLVLLAGTGLMVRSLISLQAVDPGFDVDNLTVMRTGLRGSEYAEPGARVTFYARLIEQIEALPEVVGASAANRMPPFRLGSNTPFEKVGGPPAEPGQEPRVEVRSVTPGYVETLGLTLISGAPFERRDGSDTEPVAMVNRAAQRRFWPQADPVDDLVTLLDDGQTRRIVAVVGNTRSGGIPPEPQPLLFVPHAQRPIRTMTIAVRSRPGAVGMAEAIQQTIVELEPRSPVYNVSSMQERIDLTNRGVALTVRLLGGFAALALLLVSVGIHAVMSQAVSERFREFGIRMALGAQGGEVLRLIVRDALTIVAWGAPLGVLGALGLSRFLSGLLYGVAAHDPGTFVTVLAGIAGLVVAASCLPGLRAARANPADTLRVT